VKDRSGQFEFVTALSAARYRDLIGNFGSRLFVEKRGNPGNAPKRQRGDSTPGTLATT
jgi:hypothetical protein